ncbi:MAG: hypothetical protein R2855_10345 [Thermomicrobiales bacterium]
MPNPPIGQSEPAGTAFRWGFRRRSTRSMPVELLAPSLLVTALVLLPLAYLIYRASQADEGVFHLWSGGVRSI